jgi:hypothetical protein
MIIRRTRIARRNDRGSNLLDEDASDGMMRELEVGSGFEFATLRLENVSKESNRAD